MSYCRLVTPNCDVYVFHHCDIRRGLVCCGCTMFGSFSTLSRAGMIEHLELHMIHGGRVPRSVLDGLREEIADVGDEVTDVLGAYA